MKKFICLAFIWSVVTCVAHAQIAKDATEEKELQKDLDAFTSANAAKWEELERTMSHLSDSAIVQRAERFANNPFIRAFNIFTQQNADRYAAVRSVKFAQYGPPPPALLALSWDTTSLRSPRKVIGHIDLFSVIFLRSFDPSMIAQVANSPALHASFKELTTEEDDMLQYTDSTYNAAVFLYPEQWATIIRMSAVSYLQLDAKDYAKRVQRIAIFGNSSYARQLNDNEWEVWNISALDATCHIWNIRSGYTRNVRYWIRQEAS